MGFEAQSNHETGADPGFLGVGAPIFCFRSRKVENRGGGGGGGVGGSEPYIFFFAPENLKIAPAENAIIWGGGGGPGSATVMKD